LKRLPGGEAAQGENRVFRRGRKALYIQDAHAMRENRPGPRTSRRRSLSEELADIDGNILALLLRRHNLLQKLLAAETRPKAETERELRVAWERNAARVSRDPRVTRQLFSLIGELRFLPKPAPGETERQAFLLAPTRRPVNLDMPGPGDCRRTRLYLALAAGSGLPLRIENTLLNDPLAECVKAFNQAGGRLSREEDASVLARAGAPLSLPDKVIFVGDDPLNFYLLLFRYPAAPSRAKFTGGSALKLSDLSSLRRFLPLLGARLSHVIPKSDGLPARLEASGMLPEEADIPADLPADAVTGLLMAAPFPPGGLRLDLSAHALGNTLLEEAVGLFRACGVGFEREGARVRVEPGVRLPLRPDVGMDPDLAGALLALPAFCGGAVRLTGSLSAEGAEGLEPLLENAGLRMERTKDAICARAKEHPDAKAAPLYALPAGLNARFLPLAFALAVLPALRGEHAPLPELPENADATRDDPVGNGFLETLGLRLEGRTLPPPAGPARRGATPWTAPTPAWAMSLALCAFARPRLVLANPGVMTGLYPRFWTLYNALHAPEERPAERRREEREEREEPEERRDDGTERKRLRIP
jgi:5-enolpyruvylshikimate-3-phosphate synthase